MADTFTLWTGAAISACGVVLGFALNSVSGILMDLAQEALGREQKNLEREVNRAKLKASKIATGQPRYLAAMDTVTAHLRSRTGHRLLFWK